MINKIKTSTIVLIYAKIPLQRLLYFQFNFGTMEGTIFINGDIGSDASIRGIELIDVIQQVKAQPEAESFTVYINSRGGRVDVGFDIYNYLKSLTVPVNTIGVNMVASIATVIFMAGETRKLRKGTEFMIHLPHGMAKGTSEQIEMYSTELKKVEKKMVDFYTKATGLTAEAIEPLLRNETFIEPETALALNIVTEVDVEFPMVAKAVINLNPEIQMTAEDKSWIESQFESFKNLFKAPIKAIKLMDATGQEIEFPTVEDGQTPAVGDQALLGGEPVPDGTYVMPSLDNAEVTFVGGVIATITPSGGGEDEELEALKAENEALKTQLAEIEAKKVEADAKITKMESDFETFKNTVMAKFEPGQGDPNPKPEPTKSTAMARLEKLKSIKNKQ